MKYLKIFEEFEGSEMYDHLKQRGIDPDKTRCIFDEKEGDVFFFLYNLSGQLIGYHKYNPKYPKTGQGKLVDPRLAKYFTWVSDDYKGKKIAVWGLESTNIEDKFLFICEGLFDAARIQEAGYPAIAVLCNDPSSSLKSWLNTLPQKKIVIYDNDSAGKKLRRVGDYSYSVSGAKDINDLNIEDAKIFLNQCLKSSKLI